MKYKSVILANTIEDAEKDFKTGQKLSRYVMGEEAVFIPSGFSWAYIPYSAITNIEARTQNYAANGCCGSGVYKLPVLVIEHSIGKQILQCDNIANCAGEQSLLRSLTTAERSSSAARRSRTAGF